MDDLFATADDRGLQGIALSRASWFGELTASERAVVVPVVGGHSVWESVEDPSRWLFVIEEPNYFGRLEMDPPAGAARIRVPQVMPAEHVAGLRSARHLAGALRQIPGAKLPHGQPESPVFVVSLPGPAREAAKMLLDGGFLMCTALGHRFPEFPGGLRVQVAWPQHENSRFCDIVRSVVWRGTYGGVGN